MIGEAVTASRGTFTGKTIAEVLDGFNAVLFLQVMSWLLSKVHAHPFVLYVPVHFAVKPVGIWSKTVISPSVSTSPLFVTVSVYSASV